MRTSVLAAITLCAVVTTAAADEGWVYISLPDIDEIHKLNLETDELVFHTAGPSLPLYGEIGPDGVLYVGDFANGSIYKVYPDGTNEVLTSGNLIGAPLTVAIHPVTHDLYVTDALYQRIVRVDRITGEQKSFVENDAGLMHVPGGITWGRDGNMYMTDHGTHHLIRISPDGEVEKFVDGPSIGMRVPAGIESDYCGNLFVCSYLNNQILRFREDTAEWEVFCDDPLLGWPNDIEMAPQGGLYITNEAKQSLVHVDALGRCTLVHRDVLVGGWLGVAVPGEHPAVGGFMEEMGEGTEGSDGMKPRLQGMFDPMPGCELGYVIDHAAANTRGLMIYGLDTSELDVWGGTFYIDFSSYWGWIPYTTDASGEKRFRFLHPDGPVMEGRDFYMQAVVFDEGNPYSKAMTNGLHIHFGNDPCD